MSIHEHLPPQVRKELKQVGVDERQGIGEVSAGGGSAVRLCTLGAQSSHHDEGTVQKGSREGIDRAGE